MRILVIMKSSCAIHPYADSAFFNFDSLRFLVLFGLAEGCPSSSSIFGISTTSFVRLKKPGRSQEFIYHQKRLRAVKSALYNILPHEGRHSSVKIEFNLQKGWHNFIGFGRIEGSSGLKSTLSGQHLPKQSISLIEKRRRSGCYHLALVMGVDITFPPHPQTALPPSLPRMLQIELQAYSQAVQTQLLEEKKLYGWCLMVGGIAANFSSERSWDANRLKLYATSRELSTWYEMRKELKTVLWLDNACDPARHMLWDEAMT